MKRPRRLFARDGQRGVAAVEFALVLPILLTLTLGAIDWGWYFFVDQMVTNAAREGARAGTLLPPTPGTEGVAKAAAKAAANAYLAQVKLKQIGVDADTDVTIPGTTAIKVTIKYPVGSLTGFLTSLMPVNAVGIAFMRWN